MSAGEFALQFEVGAIFGRNLEAADCIITDISSFKVWEVYEYESEKLRFPINTSLDHGFGD